MAQGDNQLIHSGIVIGRVVGNTDFVIVTDGSFKVHAYDSQGTAIVGGKYQVYKSNNTYYVGSKLG
jgi:phenolic acid decarboxylase